MGMGEDKDVRAVYIPGNKGSVGAGCRGEICCDGD